mgnify:CR=1 FL=1
MLQTILAPNPSPMTLDGTRTFIVGRERAVVIDPGPDDPAHLDAIVRALEGRTPVAILLTHSHTDHSASAGLLFARTGAPVRMARGALVPLQEVVTEWIEDGERIETDAGALTAVATPGHAPEHVCFLWTDGPAEHDRALIAGDMFMGGGDTTLVAPPEGSLTDYLASLDRLRELPVDLVLPSHGEPFGDLAGRIDWIVAHHEERTAQTLDALDQPRTAFDVTLRLFPDLPPDNFLHALREARAHLMYLRGLGAVERDVREGLEVWGRR